MSKIRVTVVIEVDQDAPAGKEWEDIDDFTTEEVREALEIVRDKYREWNPEDEDQLLTGTKWKFETEEI